MPPAGRGLGSHHKIKGWRAGAKPITAMGLQKNVVAVTAVRKELHNKKLKTETGKDHIFCVLRHMLLKKNKHKVKREKIKGPAEILQKPEKRTPAPTVAWDVVSHGT